MKVLVYGAGVIGCYLAHVLCTAGNDVTLLARGAWKDTLEARGLEIRHHLQHKTTLDHPRIVGQAKDEQYDVAFAVMPYHQMPSILESLAALNTDIVVLVGNDLTPAEMERTIREHSQNEKQILFGFQATAGERRDGRLVCERLGAGAMDIGALGREVDAGTRKTLDALFQNTRYRMNWQPDMEIYLLCHVAAILPIGYVAYACSGNMRASTGRQRKAMMTASREAYDLIRATGRPVYPVGDDDFYRGGVKYAAMKFLYFVMAKTEIGDLVACAHCRHAYAEMELLDRGFMEFRGQKPDFLMPTWNALRSAMPDWAEIRRIYGGAT